MTYSEDTQKVELAIAHQQHRHIAVQRRVPDLDELPPTLQEPHASLDADFSTGAVQDDVYTGRTSVAQAKLLRDDLSLQMSPISRLLRLMPSSGTTTRLARILT